MTLLSAFIQFLFMNFAVLILSFGVLSKIEKKKKLPLLDFVLRLSLIFFSLIIVLQILLGIVGLLNKTAIVVSLAIILLGFLLSPLRKNFKKPQVSFSKKDLSSWQLLGLPILVLTFIRIANALLQIPLEYDNLAYHLPFATEWLQSGKLLTPYYSAFSSPISHYPSNFELLDLWLMHPFHSDLLVNLINFPILIIFALCLYKICRNFKLNKAISSLVVLLPLYMPVFLRQLGTPLVDLFFSLTFLYCIYFLQEISKNKKTKSTALYFGLALGLFLGTKYLGIVYGSILVLALLLISRTKKTIITASLGTVLTGSFFYIRNWINAGNPLFPVEINIFNYILFQGHAGMNEKISSTSLSNNVKDLGTLKEFIFNFHYMTGYQSVLIVIACSLSIFFLLKKSGKNLKPLLLLLIGTLVYFFLYYNSPYSYQALLPNVRYSMMFLLSGSLLIGLAFSRHKYLQKALCFMAPLVFFISFTSINNDIVPLDLDILKSNFSIVIATFICLILFLALGYSLYKKRLAASLALLVLVLGNVYYTLDFSQTQRPLLKTYFYQKWYQETPSFLDLMKVSDWFDQNANSASIAYSGFNFHYPFFGPSLNRQVEYININECVDCRYPDYKSDTDSIRRDPNYESWIRNLQLKEKTHLIINAILIPDVKIYERVWVLEHPQDFKEVYTAGNTYVYKIK
jgi:hypothetical protein